MQDEKLDLSFLQHIREVTGYVLISHVDVTRIVLPSLQIIRGRTLFKLNVHDDEFALIVTLSKMHNLELPALRGKIFFYQYLLYIFRMFHSYTTNIFILKSSMDLSCAFLSCNLALISTRDCCILRTVVLWQKYSKCVVKFTIICHIFFYFHSNICSVWPLIW